MNCRCGCGGQSNLGPRDRSHLPSSEIHSITSAVSLHDRWVTLITRLGIQRDRQTVQPGLYSLGQPSAHSPVLVTANYSPSFRAVRTALKDTGAYILVLDTKGINVWCAAGASLFGTDELVRQIEAVKLSTVVNHRILILPQLGAPGVAAREVKERSGFTVRWGPVLASDLPRFLDTGRVTEGMRRIRFPLRSRLAIVPAEIIHTALLSALLGVPLFLAGGMVAGLAGIAAVLAGTVLFPPLLPWLPTPNFSTKGFFLGLCAALPFAIISLASTPADPLQSVGWALTYLLLMPPVTAFLALNYTGATTFTSWSGVRREIFSFVPIMAWLFVPGVLLGLLLGVTRALGG